MAEILAEFYNLCAEILMGKAEMVDGYVPKNKLTDKQKNSQRIIEEMIAVGQQDVMATEFKKIEQALSVKES